MSEIKIATKYKKYFYLKELKMWIISIILGIFISLIFFELMGDNKLLKFFYNLGYLVAEFIMQ